MKKVIAFLLCVVMVIALGGCGSGEVQTTPEPAMEPMVEPEKWELESMVDDFGDATDETCMKMLATGSFSNTATTDSNLTAVIFYTPAVSNDEMLSAFAFRLLEYNDHPATYTSGDELVIKVKIGDDIFEGKLNGEVPNGDLHLIYGLNRTPEVYKQIYNSLLKEQDVRCIIEVGSSKYSFTIESNGFVEVANAMMKTYGYDQFDAGKYPIE